ncbi:fumarylacetoacetate hydrolase family protein [Dysgonomonas macrotermitis]|uniref:2-keto-4-pentenoate hydratase/2-oxohepta-3-ene-1,7-dioic acid hydratase (Catechol pathway) n=1 Tax=Dysgonomonas macrotermitis TaxID=1346286 RepID=A0A1M5G0X1_9BACT|nr:fumarylacetoacetate hydrolase family protein [Dysgonomonas macrotermitis]SHF97082.1 2-keto-4-pentenoate hydratase/2-oxohepta-3-ene-1,7-dioic acid hydratase (catechol pathway) [Dysgonomonas macrotermitis]
MKIICVGLNYQQHNREMGRDDTAVPEDPVLFMKPDSALLKDNKPFFIPDFSDNIHYELEVVVRINRLGKNIAERFAHRYYDELTVGIDFTARDIQSDLKEKGLPWEISKGFDNSAVIGEFVPKEVFSKEINTLDFSLSKNGIEVQKGNTSEMIHPVDKVIAYASRFFTLKIGDILFTGTPAGVGRVDIDDHLEGFLEDRKLFDFHVR